MHLLTFYCNNNMMSLPCSICVVLAILSNAFAFTPSRTTASYAKLCAPLQMGIRDTLSRFRKKKNVYYTDPIKIGSSLPEADINVVSLSDGEETEIGEAKSIQEVFGSGKSILVGMPGAFTTTCSKQHLPGYIENHSKFAKLGVDNIAVITTNDVFVNAAWAKDAGIDTQDTSQITFISDGDGELVKELGLVEDMGFKNGVGTRCKRFALVVEDGVVVELQVDDGMDDCSASSAENMIKILTPEDVAVESEEEMDPQTLALVAGGILAVFLLSSFGNHDGGSTAQATASSVQAVAPVVKSVANDNMSLLEMYGR